MLYNSHTPIAAFTFQEQEKWRIDEAYMRDSKLAADRNAGQALSQSMVTDKLRL